LLTVTEKKLTDSRKRAKILADNRKSHHPIKTLLMGRGGGREGGRKGRDGNSSEFL